jgi:hypothetical protein
MRPLHDPRFLCALLLATACASSSPPPPASAPPPAAPSAGASAAPEHEAVVEGGAGPNGESPATAARLTSEQGAALLLTDVKVPPGKPELPSPRETGQILRPAVVEICVASSGKVFGTSMQEKTGNAHADSAIMLKAMSWRYRPYLVDGKPAHFCYPHRIQTR